MSVTYLRDGKELSTRELVATYYKGVSLPQGYDFGKENTIVFPSPKPECGELERVIRDGVTTDDNGNTIQAWKVVDMFSDYTNDEGVLVTKAEQEAEYLAKLQEQKVKATEQEIQNHINEVVKGLGYDDENSIAKYLVNGNPFYDECVSISLWIGNVWVTAFTIQQEVLSGTKEEPEDIIAELPVYGE
jgi:hypothetical protein